MVNTENVQTKHQHVHHNYMYLSIVPVSFDNDRVSGVKEDYNHHCKHVIILT